MPAEGTDEVARIARARALVQSGRLQQLRETGSLSLAEIGRACGVNASTVHRWLRHEALPRGATALALYDLLATLGEALQEFPFVTAGTNRGSPYAQLISQVR